MSMLNLSHQAAVEALCSGTYLENYLNTIEFLPDDLQRNLSQMRELDIKSRELLHDIETNLNLLLDGSLVEGSSAWKKCYYGIQRALVLCQDSGDEKLSLLSTMHEHIENRSRQLDHNLENLEPTAKKEPEKEEPPPPPRKEKEPKHSVSEPVEKPAGVKRHRRSKATEEAKAEEVPPKVSRLDPEPKDKAGSTAAAAATAAGGQKKKKKRKVVKKEREMSPPELAIDPNEPTYCLCDQVSYGEMIGCDNTECKIEWYHFNCVQLTHKPKGKWFCPNCRGDRPNVMKKTL